MIPTITEAELIEQARSGSSDAAGELFEQHWLEVWRAAYAVTQQRAAADDVAMDAFATAFGRLGDYTGAGSFAAWLHRIVVNRALDHLRRERRFLGLHLRALTEEPDWDARGVERDVADAVRALKPDRRAVVVLHHWLGYSLQETAELVGVPIGTVQSRLARALGELRERLGVNDG